MRIAITTTSEQTKYCVVNGQIWYIRISKPCAISDLDDPFAKPDITPYLCRRTVALGVFEDDPNGYSARAHDRRTVNYNNPDYALQRFKAWCEHFHCNLTWEEATKLAGWC